MTILLSPPEDWKRPSTPAQVKCQVLINQQGRCKATGERLGDIRDVQFDHRPALWERKFDTEAWDTVPPANDPAYIEAIKADQHTVRTTRDAKRRAHGRRVTRSHQEHQQRMAEKANGEPREKSSRWPKRSFPQGRGFAQRGR